MLLVWVFFPLTQHNKLDLMFSIPWGLLWEKQGMEVERENPIPSQVKLAPSHTGDSEWGDFFWESSAHPTDVPSRVLRQDLAPHRFPACFPQEHSLCWESSSASEALLLSKDTCKDARTHGRCPRNFSHWFSSMKHAQLHLRALLGMTTQSSQLLGFFLFIIMLITMYNNEINANNELIWLVSC